MTTSKRILKKDKGFCERFDKEGDLPFKKTCAKCKLKKGCDKRSNKGAGASAADHCLDKPA